MGGGGHGWDAQQVSLMDGLAGDVEQGCIQGGVGVEPCCGPFCGWEVVGSMHALQLQLPPPKHRAPAPPPPPSRPPTLHSRQLCLLRSAALRPLQAGRHLLLGQAESHQRIIDLPLQRIKREVGAGLLAALPAALLAALAASRRLLLLFWLLSRSLFLGRGALGLRQPGGASSSMLLSMA